MKRLRPLPLALASLLAACATPTSQPQLHQAAAPVIPAAPPAVVNPPLIPTPVQTAVEPATVWDQLRASFAMDDCDADPAIMASAREFTRNPQRFQAQINDVLPHLAYVQQIAARHDIAGEFVLLPWVESHYQPVSAKKNRPAGMWQLMPATAQAMGIHVDKRFDGRLDVPQATDKVMALLKRYYDDLGDWRMVDYAYNTGEFAVRKMLDKYGKPATDPAIPHIPVKSVTRDHLVKLLAMACVVREPDRFHVSLPQLPADQHLVKVAIDQPMNLAQAADHAGMSANDLKSLNPGLRTNIVAPSAAAYLLLPSGKAEQFRQSALQNAGQDIASPNLASLASLDKAGGTPIFDDSYDEDSSGTHGRHEGKAYKVKSGDTLSSIAKRHKVSVKQLQRWNQLSNGKLKPGQALKISGPG